MRISPLALALLLAFAAPVSARAAELIRYRTPDGSIGFVDDEKRLPPGVEVLSRTPLDPPTPKPAPVPAPEPAAEPTASPVPAPEVAPAPADALAADTDCGSLASALDKLRCRSARERRCSHYGLPAGCAAERIAAAESWCARGAALREEIAGLDDARDAARDQLDECRRRAGLGRDCPSDLLEEAEHAVRAGELRVRALEEQCHDEGCLPGWVREGCELASEG